MDTSFSFTNVVFVDYDCHSNINIETKHCLINIPSTIPFFSFIYDFVNLIIRSIQRVLVVCSFHLNSCAQAVH